MQYYICKRTHILARAFPSQKNPPSQITCSEHQCLQPAQLVGSLTNEQEEHLYTIRADFARRLTIKYVLGAVQHGGLLWQKPMIHEMLADELVDAYVYNHVGRQQLADPSIIDPEAKDSDAKE